MRPAAPPAASAAASFCDALMSPLEPEASTSRTRIKSDLASTSASAAVVASRFDIRLQSQGLAIDLVRFDKPVVVVEVETHGRVDPGMLAQRVRQQRIEIAFGGKADRGFQRARQRRPGLGGCRLGQRLVHGLFEQGRALLVVENFEARRHAGLERKALQEALAEGVDGLHLEAARRLDGPGEQPACVQHHVGRRRAIEQVGKRRFEFRVVRRHPFGETIEHARRHLRRRRLGVGERQDALRLDAVEQQAQHAHGEHVRLAGAGIGADPGGRRGIGGCGLIAPRLLAHGGKPAGRTEEAHAQSSSPLSTSHSATRARCA